MPLTPGTRIGAYEILAPLGAGGMGEVYQARDTRLGRDVAVKTLPDELSSDSERIARLQREAQLLAALNHPHIAAIFGLETIDGAHFLVLELVDGESLADIVGRGPLPIGQSLTIAAQIVDALEAAHDKGIIHRDLKPANVMLTHEGQVKVLDFGLARTAEGDGSSTITNSPTLSFRATQAGVILGTAAYMSPEQAKGRVADKRSDVWAFGCLFFEMLTGQRAFDGEDVSDILAGILRGEPDWNAFAADTPPTIRTLVRRCIEKDRRARIPDMSVVRFMMAEAASLAAAPLTIAPPVPQRRNAMIALAGMAAGAGLLAALMFVRGVWDAPPTPPPMRFAVIPAATQPLMITPTDRAIAVSPDGKYLVYMAGAIGESYLVVRPMNQLEGVRLAGTDGARQPFFSPDGQWVGFFTSTELKKVAVSGGPPVTLCRIPGAPRGGTWSEHDLIVFGTNAPAQGLLSVAAGGGEPTVISKPATERGELDHILPSILPGGNAAVFTVQASTSEASQIGAIDLKTGAVTPLIARGTHAEYVEPGYLVYAVSGTLRAVRFDRKHLTVSTDPVPVLEGVSTASGTSAANFALTKNGSLLFVPGSADQVARPFVWADRGGAEELIPAPPRPYANPRLSPDDSRVVFDSRDQDQDVWIWHFTRKTLERLTTDPALDQNPIWTKDGRRIVYNSTRGGGAPNIHVQAADGTGTIERWTTSTNVQIPFWISADGRSLAFIEIFPATGPDLMLLHREPAPRTVPLVQTPFNEGPADLSPDGRWIAYQSNQGGPPQIYVRPFPSVDEGRWQISTSGGNRPVWGRDGKELFFLDLTRALISVPVQMSPTFSPGQPVKLFDSGAYVGLPGRSYDVSRDSRRFLIVKDSDAANRNTPAASMVVVLNWLEELKARVPAASRRAQ